MQWKREGPHRSELFMTHFFFELNYLWCRHEAHIGLSQPLQHKDKPWRARVINEAAHVHIVVTLVQDVFLADAYLTFVSLMKLDSSKIKWDSPQIKPKNCLLWIALHNKRTRSAKSIYQGWSLEFELFHLLNSGPDHILLENVKLLPCWRKHLIL